MRKHFLEISVLDESDPPPQNGDPGTNTFEEQTNLTFVVTGELSRHDFASGDWLTVDPVTVIQGVELISKPSTLEYSEMNSNYLLNIVHYVFFIVSKYRSIWQMSSM